MKLTAKQYIDWALHDLVEYGKLQPIRSELPDLYGKSKLFDAAVVTNRVGRFMPVGLLLSAFMFALVNQRLPPAYHILAVVISGAGLVGGGWALRRGAGAIVGFVVFLPLLFMEPGTWMQALKWLTAAGLVVAGWRVLSYLGILLGAGLGGTMIFMPPLSELPEGASIFMAFLMVLAGWSILSRAAVVVALKAADGLSFTELVSELKHLSRLIPSPGSVDAFEYYAALVLVFEAPVPAAKRDQLISLRQSSPMGRMLTDIWIVELDAGTMYALDTPWNVRSLVPVLEEAQGRRGDAPAWDPPEPSVGQRTARTAVAWATIGLVAVNSLIHLAVYTEHPESENLRILRSGLGHAELEQHGQAWRMVTSMFLHGDKWHLAGNMLWLLEAGRSVELFFGTGWTLALFLLTGLGGNVLSDWHYPWMGLGASGAIFGFTGVLVSVFVFRGVRLSLRYRSHVLVIAALSSFILLSGLTGGPSNVGHWAHLGGALSGMVAGLILPFKREDEPARWGGTWFGLASIAVVAWAFSMMLTEWDWTPSEFTSERSEGNRLVIERPVGWWLLPDRHGRVVMIDGGSAEVSANRIEDDLRGIVTMPAGELKQYFEEMIRESEGTASGRSRNWRFPIEAIVRFTIEDFDAGFVPLSEGKALSIRFTASAYYTFYEYFLIPFKEEVRSRNELIVLPLENGTQLLRLECDPLDVEYYKPVFSRIKNTFRSLEPAFGNIPDRSPG